MDDFKDAPFTIGELRADRSGSGTDWKPRDVLVRLLRDIDAGRLNPEALVVVLYDPPEDDAPNGYIYHSVSSPLLTTSIAMIEITRWKMLKASF